MDLMACEGMRCTYVALSAAGAERPRDAAARVRERLVGRRRGSLPRREPLLDACVKCPRRASRGLPSSGVEGASGKRRGRPQVRS